MTERKIDTKRNGQNRTERKSSGGKEVEVERERRAQREEKGRLRQREGVRRH